jgi:predicted molibdopterin-dependent oxidoreductase YjgC
MRRSDRIPADDSREDLDPWRGFPWDEASGYAASGSAHPPSTAHSIGGSPRRAAEQKRYLVEAGARWFGNNNVDTCTRVPLPTGSV